MVLVDTNVLLDVFTADPRWADWSQAQLDAASVAGVLVINPVIFAEISIGFSRLEELETVLSRTGIALEEIPRAALFLAGRAFKLYKSRAGKRTGVLPDFFIGAHAAVLGVPLLTRDSRRYADYFPTLELIAPR